MFGRSRRKATEHTINAVRPLIAVRQSLHGLPADFWRNEFVIGFIGSMISFHANITFGRKLSQEDKGNLLFDVFTALSNMNGKAIAENYLQQATETPKSKAFKKGADNAAICAFFSIGKLDESGRPWIEQAEKLAAAQGAANDPSAIAGSLLHLLFYQPLREEFSEPLREEFGSVNLPRLSREELDHAKTMGVLYAELDAFSNMNARIRKLSQSNLAAGNPETDEARASAEKWAKEQQRVEKLIVEKEKEMRAQSSRTARTSSRRLARQYETAEGVFWSQLKKLRAEQKAKKLKLTAGSSLTRLERQYVIAEETYAEDLKAAIKERRAKK